MILKFRPATELEKDLIGILLGEIGVLFIVNLGIYGANVGWWNLI
jgi:hypothetical protein